MRNSSSVPPKVQGESNFPSGTAQSGKSLQNKSQFRTIAPKIVPKVLTSRVLPCPPPSLCDQGTLPPSLISKSLGMPTQNYALMQVAGQEGTFSLVALPNIASAQPVQKPRMSLPENLKLPIPRYRPLSNKGLRKKRGLSCPESSCNKPPASQQTSPSPHALPELPPKSSPFKQTPHLVPVTASTSTATPTSGDGHGDVKPLVSRSHEDQDLPATTALSAPAWELSALQSPSVIWQNASHAGKEADTKPAIANDDPTGQVDPAQALASLSPAMLNSAIQLVSFSPKGRLSIPSSSTMKTIKEGKTESDTDFTDFSPSAQETDYDEKPCVTEILNIAPKVGSETPATQESKQSVYESSCPATKLDLSHKAKLSSGVAKRRGRKRKVPDDILAFQGKRRKSMINMCRDGKERAKHGVQESRDQKNGPPRKYRSIMPKPVIFMSAMAPLATTTATLQSHPPSSLGQDILLNSSLASKCLGSNLNSSPAHKPSFVFRNGFSGSKKPWHRCPVCNHHFQFKQHLLDHMNTHTNMRPYSCRICRKAYVRSGSLSAHMKLHHGEIRPKKLVCCEFCAKVFGHVRVYFGHLKEVHRVVISTEPSAAEPGNRNGDRDAGMQGPEGSLERESKSSLEEDFLLNQADEVKLQIRCGRCQITTQSFAEIKFHLLHAHGEEIQGRLQEVILPGSRDTTPAQKQQPEKRKQVKPCASVEDPPPFPKLERQSPLHHENEMDALAEGEGSPHTSIFWSHLGFNCLLCTQTLGRKEDLLLHWGRRHNCEDPSKLWAILSTFFSQGAPGLCTESRK